MIQGKRIFGRGNNKFNVLRKSESEILYLGNRQQISVMGLGKVECGKGIQFIIEVIYINLKVKLYFRLYSFLDLSFVYSYLDFWILFNLQQRIIVGKIEFYKECI